MKKLLMLFGILLCCAPGTAPIFAQTAPTASPTGGTYSSAQTVTLSGCDSGSTVTFTTDGSLPTLASTPYTAPITVSTSKTVKFLCAAQTSTSQNINLSFTDWKCVTINGGTSGGHTCQVGGGIGTIQPSAWTWTDGTTMSEGLSTTSAKSETQMLFVYNKSDTANSTHIAEDKWIEPTQGKTYIANNELDMLQVDHTTGVEHMFGLQCNQQSSTLQWQIDNTGGTGWKNTGITDSCPLPTGVYTHVVFEGHWINGDTSNGGKGTLYYDALTINGVRHALNMTLAGAFTTWPTGCGLQDQIDLTNTTTSGANPTTAGRNIQNENLSCGYALSAVTSASYIISGAPIVATPTALPAAGTYGATQSVALSDSTSGASIYYTTNGIVASCTGGTLYSGAISVAASQTISAVGCLSGYTTSNPLTAAYVIGTPQLATPVTSPSPGTYATAQSVTLIFPSGSTGCYKIGAAPTAPTAGTCGSGSTTYTGAISVSATETIQALATQSGYANSNVFSGTFTIGTVPPVTNNIDYTQIKQAQRNGNGGMFQMAGAGSFISGHVPVYDANANLIDSGAAPGGGSVSSVANSDSTLTITPTTGTVIASLNLAHANAFSANQSAPNLGATGPIIAVATSTTQMFYNTSSNAGGFAVFGPNPGTVPSFVGEAYSSDGSLSGPYWQCVYLGFCTFYDPMVAPAYSTSTNCSSSASPAVCGSAAGGSVAVATSATTVVVDTTAVTANSQIQLTEDASLGTKLSVTCNTTPATAPPEISARTAGTSFTIKTTAPSTHPRCFSYTVEN